MRAALSREHITLEPGRPVAVDVEVTNSSQVIDGLSASIDAGLGLDARSTPALLPLFPDGTGLITLVLEASATFPAGTYPLDVVVRSSVHLDEQLLLPIEVEIAPAPGALMHAVPLVRTGRHKARYQLVCDNIGNTPLDVSLAASDAERAVSSRFDPLTLSVEPGATATAAMEIRARRHFLGGEVARVINVVGTAGPVDVDTRASFHQQPVIPRGLRTVLVLTAIIALWATVFVVAIDKALTKDKLAKDVPPSFYVAAASTRGSAGSAGYGPNGGLIPAAASLDAAPAGAVPKSGVVIGVGGTISGTVDAQSTGAGIGRITVEAIFDGPTGPQLVSSAATADDGSYSLVGLLPGPYKLLFTAQGYRNVWYPAAGNEAAAQSVNVNAQATTSRIDAVVTGAPGSITGQVATGQTPQVPVTVTVFPQQGGTRAVATVTTDAAGTYAVPNLPTPGSYDLSFSAPGYQVASDTEALAGGETHIATTIDLSAGPGTLAGTVTNGHQPLGGVTITANANGQTITSATPTTGSIGRFTIPNLTTPATYLLTFTKPGYGTETIAEHLGPGQQLSNLSLAMLGGAGQVTGTVTASTGQSLGGVTVTVAGGQAPVTTQTLTAGSVGAYLLSGLATPGRYILTFSLAGYQSETIGVSLGSSGSATGINVTLPLFSGTITGTVKGPSGPLSGVSVSATNGTTPVHSTVTSSSPPGGFSLTGLPPGAWSIAFTMPGFGQATALVILQPGQQANVPVALTPSSI
jgi:hypothetical protein